MDGFTQAHEKAHSTLHIGERIAKLRKEKKLTQKDLATRSGISLSSLKRYESGERQPHIEQLQAISQVLDTPLHELLGLIPPIDTPELHKQVEAGLQSLLGFYKPHPKMQPVTLEKVYADMTYTPSGEDLLLMAYDQLNDKGKQVAIERVEELGKVPEYQGEISDYDRAVIILSNKQKKDITEPDTPIDGPDEKPDKE